MNQQNLTGASLRRNAYGKELSQEDVLEISEKVAKDKILAEKTGGMFGLVLLSELFSYYREKAYFPQLNGILVFGEMRAKINDYLQRTALEREMFLRVLVRKNREGNKRTALLHALSYFTENYPRLKSGFKSCLTKEEYLEL